MVRLRRMAYRLTVPSSFSRRAPAGAPAYCSSTVLKYSDPVGCGT
jgi:hypothetical protein